MLNKKSLLAASFFILISGIYPSTARAATLEATPTTLKTILTTVNPGDVIQLHAGIYPPVVLGRNGYSLTNYPGERPIFDGGSSSVQIDIVGSSITLKGDIFLTNSPWTAVRAALGSQNILIDGLEVTRAPGHGIMSSGKNVTIQHTYVHDAVTENINKNMSSGWGSCIKGERGADGLIIQNNRVEHCYGEAIAVTMVYNSTIKNNTIHSSWAVGIYVDNVENVVVDANLITCQDPAFYRSSIASPSISGNAENYSNWTNRFINVSFTNNIIIGCQGIAYWGDPTPPTLKILNNTILNVEKAGIYAEGTGGAIETRNNIINSSMWNMPSTQSNNVLASSVAFAASLNPLDPSSVKLKSDVIGYSTGITTDYAGNPRTLPLSVGAWEFGATSTPTPPPSLTPSPSPTPKPWTTLESDYSNWSTHYLQSLAGFSSGDFSENGVVDGVDYVLWLINYAN